MHDHYECSISLIYERSLRNDLARDKIMKIIKNLQKLCCFDGFSNAWPRLDAVHHDRIAGTGLNRANSMEHISTKDDGVACGKGDLGFCAIRGNRYERSTLEAVVERGGERYEATVFVWRKVWSSIGSILADIDGIFLNFNFGPQQYDSFMQSC